MCLSVWVACAEMKGGRRRCIAVRRAEVGGQGRGMDVRVDCSDSIPTLWFLFQWPHKALVLTAFKAFN